MTRTPLLHAALLAAFALTSLPALSRADNCDNDAHCKPIRAERNVDASIRFVIIGDGFTAAQEQTFYDQAGSLFSGMQQFSPYKEYQSLFNVYALFTASTDSGITHQAACGGQAKNTAFQSTFGCYNPGASQDERMLTTNNGLVQAELSNRFSKFQFGRDLVVVIANDTTYGGTGGQVAVISMNADAPRILFHEAGHTFAHLADEYWTPYAGYPAGDPEPNAAFLGDVAAKWSWWIDGTFAGPTCSAAQESPPNTPTPIPYTAINPFLCSAATDLHTPVGAYEGARYLPTGVYRPTPYCMMETLWGVQTPNGQTPDMSFCPICSEAIALSFDTSADFIEAPAPAAGDNASCVQPGSTVTATVPSVATFDFTWTLDGSAGTSGNVASQCGAVDSAQTLRSCTFTLDQSLSGTHTLQLQIIDHSGAIKKPGTDSVRTKNLSWNLTVGGCDGSGATDAGDTSTDAGDTSTDDGGVHNDAPTPSTCGNGVIDPGEQCDSADINGATCASATSNPNLMGNVFCSSTCQLDTSLCKPSTCGNGVVDTGEQCDGTDLNGATCASAAGSPGPDGTLYCSSLCQFSFEGCSGGDDAGTTPVCGDGAKQSGEECDTWDFGTATCASVTGDATSMGTLTCTSACTIDSSGCMAVAPVQAVCGDGILEQGEQCDGFAFGSATCASVTGDPTSAGTLTCSSTCTIDSSGCASPAVCGNGTLDQGEQCDGSDFGSATCASVTGDSSSTGTLVCNSDCTIDSSGCASPPACGNGVLDQGEQCDGSDFGSATCASITGDPSSTGALGCNEDCTIDSSGCASPPVCGNGVLEQGEACDGSDFGSATCASVTGDSSSTGTLACNGDCTIDSSGCSSSAAVCGNGVLEQGEQCDGSDFGDATCASVTGDSSSTGTLACNGDCTIDSSGCTDAPVCGNGVLENGEQCDGSDFGDATCATVTGDSGSTGDLGCNSDCTIDTSGCTPSAMCGNGVMDPGEDCDGADFGSATCASVTSSAAATGTLGCSDTCSFDTSSCFPDSNCSHAECSTGSALDASCTDCTTTVCNDTPSCCSDTWDQSCVDLTIQLCGICP